MKNNAKLCRALSLAASIAFTTLGVLFLCLSIFTQPKNTAYLALALGSILLANLFNVIRGLRDRKAKP